MAALFLAVPKGEAAPGDEHWDRQFGWPGSSNLVFALKHHAGKLYVGGYNPASGATNSSLDVWDGTRWSSLGVVHGGLRTTYDFEFLGGDIYVGGGFSGVNGVAATGLARWNGASWSAVGGFRGAVFALAADGNNLYVGGTFTNVGGVVMTNVARWDGTSWSPMGAGLGPYDPSARGGVAALLWTGTELYAGGGFTNSGNTRLPALARWTGSAWTGVGDGVTLGVSFPGSVWALAWNGADLFVGGDFTVVGNSLIAVNVAKWNGASWSAPLSQLNAPVSALAVLGNDLYVGGGFTNAGGIYTPGIARWNGSQFYSSAGILNGAAEALLTVGTNLYMGGVFSVVDDRIVNNVARRSGGSWAAVGTGKGLSFVAREVSASSNGIYAGGFFTAAGTTAASRIARWDGTNWSPLGSGMKGTNTSNGTVVTSITPDKTDLYAAGIFTNAGGVAAANVAVWRGQTRTWQALGSGLNGGVQAMEMFGGALCVGGLFTTAGGAPASRLALWNGSNWSEPGGGVSSNVNSIAVQGSNLYVGGRFTLAGGSLVANRIAKWNGSTWSSLGSGSENGLNGTVVAVAVNETDVFVGGSFTMAGTVPVTRVARWDGTRWSALGGGLSGGGAAVNEMRFHRGKLYVAGSFATAGSVAALGIASWDGTNWSALGSGLTIWPGSASGSGLAGWGDDLYVAGAFFGAGGRDSHHFARWNEVLNFDQGPTMRLSNPRRQGNSFGFQVDADGFPGFVIEATTDFGAWTPLLTNSVTPYEFSDPIAPGRLQRLYRLRGL